MMPQPYKPEIFIADGKYQERIGKMKSAGFTYLTATDLDTLHTFARHLGLKSGRFINQSGFPHYRLIDSEIGKARVYVGERFYTPMHQNGAVISSRSADQIARVLVVYYDQTNQWIYENEPNQSADGNPEKID